MVYLGGPGGHKVEWLSCRPRWLKNNAGFARSWSGQSDGSFPGRPGGCGRTKRMLDRSSRVYRAPCSTGPHLDGQSLRESKVVMVEPTGMKPVKFANPTEIAKRIPGNQTGALCIRMITRKASI
jgi:hypothetical protein